MNKAGMKVPYNHASEIHKTSIKLAKPHKSVKHEGRKTVPKPMSPKYTKRVSQ
jgi:hypothetical protein